MTTKLKKKTTSALAVSKPSVLTAMLSSSNSTGLGMDMTYHAIGPEPDAVELSIPPASAQNVVTALSQLANQGKRTCVISRNFWKLSLPFTVSAEGAVAGAQGDDERGRGSFKIWFQLSSGLTTVLQVRVQHDVRGGCWINLSGNATSLALGYNAFAPDIPDTSPQRLMRELFRLPWRALQAVMRSAGSRFALDDSTKSRIHGLDFRLATHQVFTYVPVERPVPEFVSFLRSTLSVPFSSDGKAFSHIGRSLGVRVIPNPNADTDDSLLIFVNVPGQTRRHLSLNIYDKRAKAQSDHRGRRHLTGDETRFLGNHVRLDISLSTSALQRFVKASGLSAPRGSVTAALFCRACSAFATKAVGSAASAVAWLVHHVFDECLRLRALLRFSPSILKKALAAVDTEDKECGRLMRAWAETGFVGRSRARRQVTCLAFLKKGDAKGSLGRRRAHNAIKRMRAYGINVDLPLEVCNVFFAQTFSWAMSPQDRATYARALQERDNKTVDHLQQVSREKTVAAIKSLASTIKSAPQLAHVPTISVRTLVAPGPATTVTRMVATNA